MNKTFLTVSLSAISVMLAGYLLYQGPDASGNELFMGGGKKKKKTMEEKAMFAEQRMRYEYDMVKDGGTGLIPGGIHEMELQQARRIPEKERSQDLFLSPFADNSYTAAGPFSFGGRTRAVAFDKRFGTGSNRVILAGAVSGGLFRSADGGTSWTLVTPQNEIHNVSAIAQDPRAGNENTWYAGGGEPIGNSATPSAGGAFYYGYGLMKSTDNGLTWNRVSSTFAGELETFDDAFDFVHKILVHPITGHVYVAGHRRLLRSTDNGTTFSNVFIGTQGSFADNGQLDIACTNSGRIYLAVNGGFPDKDRRGLWFSETGNLNSWTRFAGGQTLNADSIPGWRANSYTSSGGISTDSRRILLALAPSNNNILYAYYENGLSQEGSTGTPEADLFKFDFGASTYTNLSANMPDFNGQKDGIDPLAVQGGYDMMVVVKPDNPNMVFVGGTNLYRSNNGFTNTSGTSWIGGYKYWGPGSTTFNILQYDNHHADVHNLVFDPSNPNRALCATDGGLHLTTDITATTTATEPVKWTMVQGYQTAQYYHVRLEHRASGTQPYNFIGGMQDNGSYLKAESGNDHTRAGSGDGGAAAIGKFISFDNYTLFVSSQLGSLARLTPGNATSIKPTNLTPNSSSGEGEFVTYFGFDADNPEDLYYVNFNRVFRTTNATTVTATTGWTELTGVAGAVNPADPGGDDIGIRAIELSRGPYLSTHAMYIGTTEGRVFRLNDPRNAAAATQPVDITPPQINTIITNTLISPSPRVNVSGIAINPNDDNEVMVVYSNYTVTTGTGGTRRDFNIWWTTNAKSANPTWTLIEGNLTLPSIRSCAIVARKDGTGKAFTEYYVGTSVGLYSTLGVKDTLAAGKPITWKREGGRTLNYAVVTSLAYRPQDNTLLVGTHGNGMFYTTIPQPNFTPNLNTGVNDPVRNDKNFIQNSWPGITDGQLQYRIGNMFEVKKLVVQVHSLNGQLVYRNETGYQNGNLNLGHLARGTYVLTITSGDYKQQFVRKFLKK
ncbi:T9SS type A sorting domain-containing protein [Flavihumibacter stibioxidans]|uniref:Secretion system C-terminal sorting domain-containing protein n=1 Tax=Flavihumibacter stibioxidans TaxID=1834163 RepID=A0ABR7M7U8_9BACT|nr:T9SS type A sorting domain-containing protein [Flavihumibacter stibioxidans]MBC6490614.1 hypothetical protein [Flavihumibacter stibioxidans]